ncbi:MAG: hypothetical protein HY308_14680 [Gammaproteobacteria bacterium]|nr:hypothetical protein [Gammaproteobacteria bacterium]
MNKLSRLLTIVLLLTVAVYAGLKYYLYSQTHAAVERFRQQVALFVAVEYRGIGSTLWGGTVQIDELTLKPNGIDDVVSISEASFSAGSLRHLLRFARHAKDNTPPDSFRLVLHDVKLQLDGELVNVADRFLAAASERQPTRPNCGNLATNQLGFLRELGYETLTADFGFDYTFNGVAGLLKLRTEAELKDMNRFVMDIKFSGVQAGLADFKTASPRIKEVGVVLKDLSYNERLRKYCAKAAGITEAQYLQAEVEHGGAFFQQLGILPGPGIRAAYRDYLTTANGELALRAQPSEDLPDLRALAHYKPADAVTMLNLVAHVNGKPIEDLSFVYGELPAAAPAVAAAPEPPPAAKPPVSASVAPPAATGQFRPVLIAELKRYLHRYVRVHERGQPPREGTLVEVTNRMAVLERRAQGSVTVARIPLTRIGSAEVRKD